MKILLSLIISFSLLFSGGQAIASPLIFRATKDIAVDDLAELVRFDATKYKQIRVTVKFPSESQCSAKPDTNAAIIRLQTNKDVAQIELNAAKRELDRTADLVKKQVISPGDLDAAQERLKTAESTLNTAEIKLKSAQDSVNSKSDLRAFVLLVGVDGEDELLLDSANNCNIKSKSFIIDVPPSKIAIKVSGRGVYKVFVWGNL